MSRTVVRKCPRERSAPPASPDRARRARWQRAYRARYAAGCICASAPVSGDVVDMLIQLRWLEETKAGDRYEVGRAIARMLEDAAKG
jgi:hypothetical protein